MAQTAIKTIPRNDDIIKNNSKNESNNQDSENHYKLHIAQLGRDMLFCNQNIIIELFKKAPVMDKLFQKSSYDLPQKR